MEIVWALLVGAVIGWVAGILMKTEGQQGLLMNIVIGIVGSILGHFLAPKLGIGATSDLGRIAVSLGGAVLLIVILRALRVLR
jgi:uncharacterized membrane protein YeaQ/YmgE (transglycosylase-associated protein family)